MIVQIVLLSNLLTRLLSPFIDFIWHCTLRDLLSYSCNIDCTCYVVANMKTTPTLCLSHTGNAESTRSRTATIGGIGTIGTGVGTGIRIGTTAGTGIHGGVGAGGTGAIHTRKYFTCIQHFLYLVVNCSSM
jgi:hypothetical protein